MTGEVRLGTPLGPPRPLTAPGVHEAAGALLSSLLPPPARLCDLAAGEGAFSRRLRERRYSVLAVDRDPLAFRLQEVPLLALDLNQPFAERLGPGSFDGCVALEILEHVENPALFLRECRALLRPGGVLVLSSPNVESLASRLIFLWNGRLRFFSPAEDHHVTPIFGWLLSRCLREAGFSVLLTVYNRRVVDCGRSWKARAAAACGRLLLPWLRGDTEGEIRLVAARAGAW